ncbi:BQ5605_C014g07621 [Microbotryum silenes-dioicae]|uniref:BQ5605_C014g07621 protein n=1 Tax=Microbotryum silenes-dioicae TaxID=796604 RepID=A0A2X0NYC9_9BASI|nr:BQ5605_C014g07621 [Microbotryum silenes-dioicae]
MNFLTQFVASPNEVAPPRAVRISSATQAPFEDPRAHHTHSHRHRQDSDLSDNQASSLSESTSSCSCSWKGSAQGSTSTFVLGDSSVLPSVELEGSTGPTNSETSTANPAVSGHDADRISLSDRSNRSSLRRDSKKSDGSSFYSFTSSVDWQAQEEKTAEKFAHLRHDFVTEEPEEVPEIEPMIEPPSLKKGDVRTFSPKVVATVALWEDGTLSSLKGKGSANKTDRDAVEQWIVEGVLWITRKSELIFVIDQSVPPRRFIATRPVFKSRRSSSLFHFGRSGSKSRSTSPASSIKSDRALRLSKSMDYRSPNVSPPRKRSYLRRLFSSKKHDSDDEDDDDRSFSRATTINTAQNLRFSRTVTSNKVILHGRKFESSNAVAFQDSHSSTPSESTPLPCPFPEINHRPISSLYVSSPKLITKLVYHPASRPSRSRFGSVHTLESSAGDLLLAPHPLHRHGSITPPADGIAPETTLPSRTSPSLEMDVAPLVKMSRLGSRATREEEAGHLREVTVTIHFETGGGGLLSNDEDEAQQFYEHLCNLMERSK